SPEEKRALSARTAAFSEQDLIRFFDQLLKLDNELRWTSQPRFHLEVGFIKLAKIAFVRDIEELLREVKDGGPIQPKREEKPAPAPSRPPEPKPELKPSSNFSETFTQRVEEKSAITSVYVQKADRIERSGDNIQIVFTNATQLSMAQSKEHKS